MIKNILYYATFLTLGGAIMLLLCVDLGQGTPSCLQPRQPATAKDTRKRSDKKSVQVVRKKPKQAPVKKKPLVKDDSKHKKELEKSKLRIQRLEQRLAQLSRESAKLMASLNQKLLDEQAARKKTQQEARAARTEARARKELLSNKFEQERKSDRAAAARKQQALLDKLTAQHQATQAQATKRQQALAKQLAERQQREQQTAREHQALLTQSTTRQQAIEQAMGRQEAELAAQRNRQQKAEQARHKAQIRMNQMIATQARQLKTEREQRKALEHQLDTQRTQEAASRKALARQLDTQRTQEAANRKALRKQLEDQARSLAAQKLRMSELAHKPRRRPGRTVTRVTNWQQYLDFLAPVQSIKMDKVGRKLPVLDFNGQVFADNLNSIMRFYQMGFYGLLIYRERNEKDPNYLAIDLSRGPSRPRFTRKTDTTEVDNLASIGLLWNSSSIGRQLMQRIQTEQPLRIPRGAFLALVNLFPRSTAQYFIWKRIEVCRRNGIDPAKVNRCLATFRQTQFGSWIVVIRQVEMKDGSMVAVSDFEEAKVTLRRG